MSGKRIFGAFVAAIALFFVFPGLVGSWQKVNAMRAAVAEREETLAKRQEILTNAQAVFQTYQQRSTSQQGKQFAAFVPVKKDTAELISALQAIATQAGIQLLDIGIAERQTNADQTQKALLLSLTLEGSYSGVKQFLSGAEQYVRLLNVQEITISSEGNPDALDFTVEAEAYFLK